VSKMATGKRGQTRSRQSPLDEFTREIDEADREYIEELVGYNNWDQFRGECPSDPDSLTCCDDAESFAPFGGPVLPSQRFFAHHTGLRREIETPDDNEDDDRERQDELEDEIRIWYQRHGTNGSSRKGYDRPFVFVAEKYGDDVGALQTSEFFAASELLRIQRLVQRDEFRGKFRTKEGTRKFIEGIRNWGDMTDKELDTPIREMVGDPLVDPWEWDSARKAEAIRKSLAEDGFDPLKPEE